MSKKQVIGRWKFRKYFENIANISVFIGIFTHFLGYFPIFPTPASVLLLTGNRETG